MTRVSKRRAAIIEMARKRYVGDGEVKVDDDARLSEGQDNGTYVQTWVWVDFYGTPLDKKPNE